MWGLVRAWLSKLLLLPRRWFGVWVGCAVWLIWMITGFWHLVLLLLLAALGYSVGVWVERGVAWRDIWEWLLSNRDHK